MKKSIKPDEILDDSLESFEMPVIGANSLRDKMYKTFGDQRLKVLHIVEPFAGGIATFIKQLTELCPEDEHVILHGDRSEIIEPTELYRRFPYNCKFIRWKWAQREINPIADSLAFSQLLKVLVTEKFDVVHLHSSKAGFLGRIACRMTNFHKVIYSPHCGAFLRTDIGEFKRKVFQRLEIFANRFSGVVICTSESENNAFNDAGILTKYVNNGAYISHLEPKIKKDVFRVICCGNITEQKNPEQFNKIARLFEHDPRFEFIWVGDGDQRDSLSSSNIRITGWISRERVSRHLRQADLYLSCSSWEGLPYAVLEAMSQECPLLLTPCVGHIDLIKSTRNGYFFEETEDAYSRILELMGFPKRRRKMGRASLEICFTDFNAENSIFSYRENYLELLKLYA